MLDASFWNTKVCWFEFPVRCQRAHPGRNKPFQLSSTLLSPNSLPLQMSSDEIGCLDALLGIYPSGYWNDTNPKEEQLRAIGFVDILTENIRVLLFVVGHEIENGILIVFSIGGLIWLLALISSSLWKLHHPRSKTEHGEFLELAPKQRM